MNKVCIGILNYHPENEFKTELFHWKSNRDIINCKNIILKSVGGEGKSSLNTNQKRSISNFLPGRPFGIEIQTLFTLC